MSKRNLNELVATQVMGWKWMRYEDIPIRGTPGYPQKCMVRRLLTPNALGNEAWKRLFQGEAYGTEPLEYCYGSSSGPAIIPDYSHDESACELVEDRLEELGLIDALPAALERIGRTAKELKRPYKTTCRQICEAALLVMKEREPHECDSFQN